MGAPLLGVQGVGFRVRNLMEPDKLGGGACFYACNYLQHDEFSRIKLAKGSQEAPLERLLIPVPFFTPI